jgi:hypothetical protein
MNSINCVHTVQYIVTIVMKQNKASILSYIWYQSKTNLAYSRIVKDQGEWSLLILAQRKGNSFYSGTWIDWSEANFAYPRHKKDWSDGKLCLFYTLERSKQSKLCLLKSLKNWG